MFLDVAVITNAKGMQKITLPRMPRANSSITKAGAHKGDGGGNPGGFQLDWNLNFNATDSEGSMFTLNLRTGERPKVIELSSCFQPTALHLLELRFC